MQCQCLRVSVVQKVFNLYLTSTETVIFMQFHACKATHLPPSISAPECGSYRYLPFSIYVFVLKPNQRDLLRITSSAWVTLGAPKHHKN